ncbi:hypothetical protein BH09CHL1_BH09CHL1_34220 [soil metagenome]
MLLVVRQPCSKKSIGRFHRKREIRVPLSQRLFPRSQPVPRRTRFHRRGANFEYPERHLQMMPPRDRCSSPCDSEALDRELPEKTPVRSQSADSNTHPGRHSHEHTTGMSGSTAFAPLSPSSRGMPVLQSLPHPIDAQDSRTNSRQAPPCHRCQSSHNISLRSYVKWLWIVNQTASQPDRYYVSQ